MTRVTSPVDLICLAHAGGSSLLYRDWDAHLPSTVRIKAIDLPGHGARRAEQPLARWPEVIDALVEETLPRLEAGVPYAVFGHSMGALCGFELIRGLERRAGHKAVWFGASACLAPGSRAPEEHWLDCPHDAMVDKLRALGGTPEALLREREFVEFMLPSLRADFHLCGTYARFAAAAGKAPLDCPIAVFTGRDDSATLSTKDVVAWSEATLDACTQHRFDGGHFFIDEQRGPLLDCVVSSLGDALARSGQKAIETDLWMH